MIPPGGLLIDGAEIAGIAGLAAAGYAYASLAPWSKLFGKALIAPRTPLNGPREIALTFDDGPNPRCTPRLLEVLARNDIRATFFLLGKYAATQPSLVREIHSAGHLVGNHTWSHPNLSRTSFHRTREELIRTNDELQQILGAPVRYFRPPFGARRPATFRLACELGLTPVLWNIIGYDWNARSAEAITTLVTRLVERNDRRGDATNLVLHDGSHHLMDADRSCTVAAVAQLVPELIRTRRFVTLDAWDVGGRA